MSFIFQVQNIIESADDAMRNLTQQEIGIYDTIMRLDIFSVIFNKLYSQLYYIFDYFQMLSYITYLIIFRCYR